MLALPSGRRGSRPSSGVVRNPNGSPPAVTTVSSSLREMPNGDVVYEYNEHSFQHQKYELPAVSTRGQTGRRGGGGGAGDYRISLGNQSMI